MKRKNKDLEIWAREKEFPKKKKIIRRREGPKKSHRKMGKAHRRKKSKGLEF